MKTALVALGFVLVVALPARSDDAAERAILNKAIKAQYGDVDPAKVAASTVRMTGKVHAMGMAVGFSGEALVSGSNKLKIDIEADVAGQKFRITNVVNGDKGWTKIANDTKELDADMMTEAKEQAYVNWVTRLATIKGKEFTLSSIGEVMIEKKPALGVKVTNKNHRDVDLYFDKTTYLLVKSETRVKDEGGKEVTEETFYSEYKEVQGTKQPMKFLVHRDGKVYLEADATEYTLTDKLDDSVFAKP
jgi:hypothetical protein